MLMLRNIEHLHGAIVFLAVATPLHSVQICGCSLACPNHFVFIWEIVVIDSEDDGVPLHHEPRE